ncbi:MAG: fused MFS/spermidine synthase [Planctomycetes bacterium]|nr:fused MFS/spermidine synthase [Planctomycetota bacterium]
MLLPALYALTLLVSSGLLFFAQPMCTKMLLPVLGGTPSVWITAMLFFQAGLLAGYAYAHAGSRRMGTALHGIVHLAGLGLAFLALPIAFGANAGATQHPVLWLLGTLSLTVGLPFFLVAATAPLMQVWFSRTGRDPYFLYAASNLGSFLALVLYPFVVEPYLTLGEQSRVWRWGFVALAALCLGCFVSIRPWRALENARDVSAACNSPAPSGFTRLRWVLLALVPSSLMLSVTSHLTTDIAPVPLLWIAPLALYLLTFTLVFAQRPGSLRRAGSVSDRRIPPMHRVAVRWLPLAVLLLAFLYLSEATAPILLILVLYLAGFFWIALVCHGELARTRPESDRLTEFYLWLAVGGVLGGIFNALIGPLVFTSLVEFPLMLVAACLLRPGNWELNGTTWDGLPRPSDGLGRPSYSPFTHSDWIWPAAIAIVTGLLGFLTSSFLAPLASSPSAEMLMAGAVFAGPLLIFYCTHQNPLRNGLVLGAIFLAGAFYSGVHGSVTLRLRDFFGVHRVAEKDGRRMLVHGNTIHGIQILDSLEPQGYYHKVGPFGQLWKHLGDDRRLDRVGLIGLGAGAMASYARPGQHWSFFEIDPAVVYVARDSGLFTYLEGAVEINAKIGVILGDGRTSLRDSPGKFGLLVIDAFGSDAIPMHLLTREALQLYLDRLDERGILAFHISNRYLDLEPVLANLARDHDPPLVCYAAEDASREHPSIWIVMARNEADLGFTNRYWEPARTRPDLRPWTDDFSNLFEAFR